VNRFSDVSASRSATMRAVRNKDTKPEMVVRRLVHRLGFRYRLHSNQLPGKPDLVFPSRHKVIFVHGCFWHRHPGASCRLARMPKLMGVARANLMATHPARKKASKIHARCI
jgi:DNA mismatch endonuclease Vsr